MFTPPHSCPVYLNGNVICVFKHVSLHGDYFWNSANTLIWMEIVLVYKRYSKRKHNSVDVTSDDTAAMRNANLKWSSHIAGSRKTKPPPPKQLFIYTIWGTWLWWCIPELKKEAGGKKHSQLRQCPSLCITSPINSMMQSLLQHKHIITLRPTEFW